MKNEDERAEKGATTDAHGWTRMKSEEES